ncbi:MAG: histidinol-phosphate transaminase [Firmicutes bacterium]|nr:histidinol-phosphate transaminase [Bacillota bacterium]
MDWRDTIYDIEPYVPGVQLNRPGLIKLNTNEFPYAPSHSVLHTMSSFDLKKLSLYPNPDGEPLRSALAEYYGVLPENILLGNGSDELLALAFLAFFRSGKPILFPDPSYSFYKTWAEFFGIEYRKLPLRSDFTIDPKDYFAENGGIVFPNPNAPTGIGLDTGSVEEIVKANPGSVVILDEAYVDFMNHSGLLLHKKYDNLLLVRTFSKSRALAGMRIGFAIGSKDLIAALNTAKNCFNSYTIDSVSIACGCAAIEDERYFHKFVKRVTATRDRFRAELIALGFNVLPSEANFVFASHPQKSAEELYEKLLENNILVRHFNKPPIENFLRITIGTDEQMDTTVSVLKKLLNE